MMTVLPRCSVLIPLPLPLDSREPVRPGRDQRENGNLFTGLHVEAYPYPHTAKKFLTTTAA